MPDVQPRGVVELAWRVLHDGDDEDRRRLAMLMTHWTGLYGDEPLDEMLAAMLGTEELMGAVVRDLEAVRCAEQHGAPRPATPALGALERRLAALCMIAKTNTPALDAYLARARASTATA